MQRIAPEFTIMETMLERLPSNAIVPCRKPASQRKIMGTITTIFKFYTRPA